MTQIVHYNDLSIRLVLGIAAAHIMTAFNESEHFFEIVVTSSYLRGFLASLIIAFLVINYIYYVTTKLDRLYNWVDNTFIRFVWQVLLGFAVPALVVFLFVALFLTLYGINIFNTVYLPQDYPLALLMLVVINLYYFGLYHFLTVKKPLEVVVAPDDQTEISAEPSSSFQEVSLNTEPVYKEMIMITTPLKTFPVNTDDVAYVFRLNDNVFILLKTMQHLNEAYQVSYSLKDLETLLDPSKFFRINRQMIVNFYCVSSFRPESAKTLMLTVSPELYPIEKDVPLEHQKLLVVSETKTPRFKLWMDR